MIINGKIKIGEELGRGSFATVYKSTIVGNYPPLQIGDVVAVKSISTNKFSTPEEREKLENENNLMKKLSHTNIVKLYGVERTSSTYFLVMEYCETGDLHFFLKKFGLGISPEMLYNFIQQIGNGLQYLKSQEIIHRDLKPQNIMIKGQWPDITLKLADFGFARFLHDNDMAETICGSPIYMAPEIQFNSPYTSAVDMWSLGVIIYEMIVSQPPFPNCKSPFELTNEIKKLGSRPIEVPKSISCPDLLRDLVSKLLTVDPTRRMTLKEFVEHQYFKSPPKSSLENTSGRKKKFSFSNIITLDKNEGPDKILSLVKESADSIEALFTDCQDIGDSVLFDLLTTMCEFLVDILYECRAIGSCQYEDQIIQQIEGYKDEADELSQTEMEPPSISALKFLFDKGMEYAMTGVKAEQDGNMSFAKFKYQKSLYILCPLVFLIGRDEEISKVRILYDQLMFRLSIPSPEENLTI